MKRYVLLFILLLCPMVSFAQSQTLQVFYVTKDYSTEVNPLCRDLRDMYSAAERDPSQAVVFYLANSTSPMIVKMNLPGDNRKDFDDIIGSLMTKSETIVNPMTDLLGLVNLFDEIALLDEDGNHLFLNAEIRYYVTPTFWELDYNEQLIASAYFALEMDAPWAKNDHYFDMSIYHCASDGLEVDSENPFGEKNLCYDYNFQLLTYSN